MFDLSRIVNKPKKKKRSKNKKSKDLARQKRNRSKKKLNAAQNWRKFTEEKAKELQKNPPKSDTWFQVRWADHAHIDDKYNDAFDFYIPDCVNHTYKYIIEVDGSYHNRPEQIEKDIKKNEHYAFHGYICYRIKAYDLDSFNLVLDKITKRRQNQDRP